MDKNKNNYHNEYRTQSAEKWAAELNIHVLSFQKSFTLEQYYDENIKKSEFLNRISLCEIKKPENISRRAASELKSKLNNKNND